jgi:hypothetical protein
MDLFGLHSRSCLSLTALVSRHLIHLSSDSSNVGDFLGEAGLVHPIYGRTNP